MLYSGHRKGQSKLLNATLKHFNRNENVYTDRNSPREKLEQEGILSQDMINTISKEHEGAKIYKKKKKYIINSKANNKNFETHRERLIYQKKIRQQRYNAKFVFVHYVVTYLFQVRVCFHNSFRTNGQVISQRLRFLLQRSTAKSISSWKRMRKRSLKT